jgi:hypothetical protein
MIRAHIRDGPSRLMQELVEWLASPEGVAATADDRDPNGKVIP